MTWDQWYRIKSYTKSSLWLVPFFAIPIALVTTRLVQWADAKLGWILFGIGTEGARAILQTLVTATLSFVVFTFGSLLVALQVASGQLTPRIIATTLLRDNVIRCTVGLFLFTLFFSLSVWNRIDSKVPQLALTTSAALGLACFAAFLYLIDYAARLLRPVRIVTTVGNAGLGVVESVYPDLSEGPPDAPSTISSTPRSEPVVVSHDGTSEIVLAVNIDFLFAEANRLDGIIEFVPQVGDFVAVEEPLFLLYGGARQIDRHSLRAAVAFGSERTMEQDPTFAFRIIIDIALRALSPAINDPTTAVLAIDQLHRLLRMVGRHHLRTDHLLDREGHLRVVFRTPNWEDFVHLTFSEIRACGCNNLQIVRRLRSMIENLLMTLPKHRHSALLEQLKLLDQEAERLFKYPEELKLARVGDSQGLGGRAGG